MKKIALLSLGLMSTCSSYAWASEISVTPFNVDFKAGQRFSDLTIENRGDNKAYVNASITKLIPTGHGTFKHVKGDGEDPYDFGLVAVPNKLILPHGQNAVIRLINTAQPSEHDTYYQVDISPVEGKLEQVKSPKKGVDVGVEVKIHYKLFITMRPIHPQYKITFKRQGQTLILTNPSNTFAFMDQIKQCPGTKNGKLEKKDNDQQKGKGQAWEDHCYHYASFRLFPGETKKVSLDYKGLPVKFSAFYPDKVFHYSAS